MRGSMLKPMRLRLRSSAYREPSFGHGCISLSTTCLAQRSRAHRLLYVVLLHTLKLLSLYACWHASVLVTLPGQRQGLLGMH